MYFINTQVKDTVQPIEVNEKNFPHIYNSQNITKAIYIEKRGNDIYVETLSDDCEYIKNAIQKFENNDDDNDTICEIRWTVEDVRAAFRNKYGREPTKGQLKDCVENVDTKTLEERSIEIGWTLIDEAII